MVRIFLILVLFFVNVIPAFSQEKEQDLQIKYQQYEQNIKYPNLSDTYSNNYYFFGQNQGIPFKFFFTQYEDNFYMQQEQSDRAFYLRNQSHSTIVSPDEYRIFK